MATRTAPDPSIHRRRSPGLPVALTLLLLLPGTAAGIQTPERFQPADGYTLPPPAVQDFFQRDTNFATLDHPSPEGTHFLLPLRTELSTLERMGERTLRLAELELRPGTDRLWHLDTWGIHGFKVFSLEEGETREVDLPDEAFASDFVWSPTGDRLAFLAHLRNGTELWTATADGEEVGPAGTGRVLATLATSSAGQGRAPSRMVQWTPDGAILTLLVPAERGAEPERPQVPDAPLIRRTQDEPVQTRTFPYLLQDTHDEVLFEHFTTAQLAEFGPDGVRPIGAPAMFESISLSPDGRYILATVVERPFSFLVSWRGFPRRTLILDRVTGDEVVTLAERPLQEGAPSGEGDDRSDFRWRPDGDGLHFVDRSDGERIMVAEPPFDLDRARLVATLDSPIRGAHYDLTGAHLLVEVGRGSERGLVHLDLTVAEPEPVTLLETIPQDDPLELRGELLTGRTANGLPYALVSTDGSRVYLQGPGYREDFRPTPFIDALSLADGSTERVFEGGRDTFDQPLVPLDPDLRRMTASRESSTLFPDSWLWEEGRWVENLTRNQDPFPELTAAQRIDFSFTRRDGLEVQARVSLPTNYREGEQVPAIFWTYPREYTTSEGYERAAIRARNHNAFHQVTWLRWSDIWLSQGYAVVHPDIPIVGENYNDTYIANLSDAMYAAIRATDELGVVDIDRIGHGGHSYGAFATVNILAHTPYFRAGIAGHGAYNRSLTPAGFQAERRTLWEAPHTYVAMSPFFFAHQIETPLLLYHGGDDNNTGTWPMQSDRLIHALTNLGKDAVLYTYPFESHTPRAVENNLDMWARWIEWFDHYVKGADGGVADDR